MKQYFVRPHLSLGEEIYRKALVFTNDAGYEPAVQFNVDGNLILSGTSTNVLAMMDVDRIEVTRGPSGAIQGRMANAGTINVVTKDPDFAANDPDRPWVIPGVEEVTADNVFFYSNDQTRPIDSYSYFGNISIPLFEDKHRFTFGL